MRTRARFLIALMLVFIAGAAWAQSSPPAAGTNTLVVTHKPNILDAFGKDWFEIKEGEASIFKSDGKGAFALIARVPIDQWATAKK